MIAPETAVSPETGILPERGRLTPPPILEGFHFDPEEVFHARSVDRLLSIQVDLGRVFQADHEGAPYGPRTLVPRSLGFREIKRVIEQARSMGARSIVLSGITAPDSSPHLRGLVAHIHSLGLVPVVTLNALSLTTELASFLDSRGASLLIRMYGLANIPEAGNLMRYLRRIMRPMREAGFSGSPDSRRARLGISVTDERVNGETAMRFWRYCRDNGIHPLLRMLTPVEMDAAGISPGGKAFTEVERLRTQLLQLDREEYGYTWPPYTPHLGTGCLRHLSSVFVSCEGNVRPCGEVALDKNTAFLPNGVYVHNIRSNTLPEIYNNTLFRYIRNIEQHLEGKSGDCEHLDTCIGCRGAAYIHHVRIGVEPISALRSECPYCFKEKGDFHGQND